MPIPPPVDISHFCRYYAHGYAAAFVETAKQIGVSLTGELRACARCSIAKGKRSPVPKIASFRSVHPLPRVFVDLSERRPVQSVGGCSYLMIIKYEFSRYGWITSCRTKSDAAGVFQFFLADIHCRGMPSVVESVHAPRTAARLPEESLSSYVRSLDFGRSSPRTTYRNSTVWWGVGLVSSRKTPTPPASNRHVVFLTCRFHRLVLCRPGHGFGRERCSTDRQWRLAPAITQHTTLFSAWHQNPDAGAFEAGIRPRSPRQKSQV